MVKENFLLALDAKGKVQLVNTQLKKKEKSYIIYRSTGRFQGKRIQQPEIEITEGKVKRTTQQQAELEYNAIVKKYLDRGYKDIVTIINKPIEDCSIEELTSLLSSKTDQSGVPKPMLAVQYEKVASKSFEKEWYCSKKIDGVRCLMYYKDGEIKTASRGGTEYNVPTQHITNDNTLINIFKQNPDLILDGELYCHGLALQEISGLARLKEWNDNCNQLEYWIYDIISDKPFIERLELLEELKDLFENDSKIKVLDHEKISGWVNIKNRHDKFVLEGFEGLVLRNPLKEYGIGKRSAMYMVKVKQYRDTEVPVRGYELGLRGAEDMVFICEAKNGLTFKAKPWGNLQVKQDYVNNFEKYYKDKLVKIKFFYYSNNDNEETGVPLQPSAIAFRDYTDM
jgi:DNA ligase-1